MQPMAWLTTLCCVALRFGCGLADSSLLVSSGGEVSRPRGNDAKHSESAHSEITASGVTRSSIIRSERSPRAAQVRAHHGHGSLDREAFENDVENWDIPLRMPDEAEERDEDMLLEEIAKEDEENARKEREANAQKEPSQIPIEPHELEQWVTEHHEPMLLETNRSKELEDLGTLSKGTCKDYMTQMKEDNELSVANLKHHHLDCPDKSALRGFTILRGSWMAKKTMKVNYRCCSYCSDMTKVSTKQTAYKTSGTGTMSKLVEHHPECTSDTVISGWKVQTTGVNMRFEYECWKPNGLEKVLSCQNEHTDWKDSTDKKTPDLAKHTPLCKTNNFMSSFTVEESGHRMRFKYRCCSIGVQKEFASYGPQRTCSWSGDPHFCSFDRSGGCNNHQLHSGDFWIADTENVKVQGRYCNRYDASKVGDGALKFIEANASLHEGNESALELSGKATGCYNSPAVTRQVAFGGNFLMGHHLFLKGNRGGVWWDKTKILTTHWKTISGVDIEAVTGGLIKHVPNAGWRRRRRAQHTLYMPLDTSITMNVHDVGGYWGCYMDCNGLKMKQVPSGKAQVGQCGNNNGVYTSDENPGRVSSTRWAVASKDNLWGINLGTDHSKLAACKKGTAGYTSAETSCKRGLKDVTSTTGQAYLQMCIYDICVMGGEKYVVKATEQTEEGFKQAVNDQQPLGIKIEGKKAHAGVSNICGTGKHLMTPFNREENHYAMMLARNKSGSTDLIRLGARYQGGMWKAGGQSICQYKNFAVGKSTPTDSHGSLCMRKSTGKWEACDSTTLLSTLCVPDKDLATDKIHYVLSDKVTPVLAREICGQDHRLAMPRREGEVTAMKKFLEEQLKDAAERVWIGGQAAYFPASFRWDDGTRLACDGKENWAVSHPGTGFDDTQTWGREEASYMSADKNGRWYNAGVDQTTSLRAVCQKAVKDRSCAKPGQGDTFASAYVRRLTTAGATTTTVDKSLFYNYTASSSTAGTYRLGEAEFGKGVYHSGFCWYLGWEFDDCTNVCYSQLGTKVDEVGMLFGATRYDVCDNVARKLGLEFKALEETETEIITTDSSTGCHYLNDKGGKVHIGMKTSFKDPDAPGCCQSSFMDSASEGEARTACADTKFWNPFATYAADVKACKLTDPNSATPTGTNRHRICACSDEKVASILDAR